MKYISSRGGEKDLTFQQVLFAGYAPDGGLYFPERIPKLEAGQLESWKSLSYPDIVKKIMKMFISQDEIPVEDLHRIVDDAFQRFENPDQPIEIARLKNGLNIAELFHGPTLAFKDLALCVVGRLYNYFLAKKGEHTTVLIGTSGDTGSAAISAVRGLDLVDVVVLLPKGRCSRIQELQMTTVLEDNVHNFVVEGTSDDLDEPIKAVFADRDYVENNNLCSINSINWARILVQIGHYFYTYLQVAPEVGDTVEIVVPTGACGNIASGYVAVSMGLPVEFVACVNKNDIVHRTFQTGDFSLSPTVAQTWASAMDIQVPYNIERMVLVASGLDTARVASLMKDFESGNTSRIPPDILKTIRTVVTDSITVVDDEMVSTMARCNKENSYTLCPHTAVGVFYHYQKSTDKPQVVIATASPDKFPEVVTEAGIEIVKKPNIEKLFTLETRFETMDLGEDWEKILRKKIDAITVKHKCPDSS